MVKVKVKAPNKKAVHFAGYPCKVDKRHGAHSFWLSSNSDPRSVTCKGCRRVCEYIAQIWR